MIAEILTEVLTKLEKYSKRRNDQEPVSAALVGWYETVIASMDATESEVRAAGVIISRREEWFPTPATFVNAINELREHGRSSFRGAIIRDALGRNFLYPQGKPLPAGFVFVEAIGPSLPNHKDRELNANNP